MGRMVKCPYCEEKLDKDEAIEYKKRYYHHKCLDAWELEKTHRKELIDYICHLYHLESPTGMMLKQIKDFHEQFGYKLKEMELALKYFYETKGNSIKEGQGIGIIPYVYEEAKKHYIMIMKIEQSVKNQDITQKSRVVTVNSPPPTYQKKTKKIDIGSL